MSLSVGVDIGGTKIAASSVDGDGAIRYRARRETPAQDPEAIAEAVADMVTELSERAGEQQEEIGAVGVACAGFVDAAGSTVLFAPNLAWRDEPLQERLERRIGLPVLLENDANAAAWGEFRFGAARDVDDMLLLTVGTGVGGGIISREQVVRGAHGAAAEVGHLRVVPEGHRCGCGNRGCWEQYASGSALEREARELVRAGSPHAADLAERCGGDAEALTGQQVTEAARDGDRAATELLEDLGHWLGDGIASLVAVLDPALVVVGGGVSAAGDLVLGPARAAYARQVTGRGHRPFGALVPAELGNDAGMIGAADLVTHRRGARSDAAGR
ncbi:ROK family glucokinase [Ornithinicoccus halotolerans]|uniref:ROK family glucokinase n=1 Tax=Ornithinicoccus halotolerans TaxID=1748220 RepID=UPI00129708D8|nr:ROK family glucokinase [Ornithinicoccus halotolerans]